MPSVSSLTFENIETGHAKSIEDILAFDQGKHLVSCSMDKTAHLWACDATKQHTNFAIRSKKVLVWAHRRRYVSSNLWKMDLHGLEG